jgi:MFS family permease
MKRQQDTKVSQRAVLALLFVSVWVNYMDRGNLGVAAPNILRDLHLPATKMGILLSAFFWTYALFQVISGWLVDRLDVKRVYAIAYLIWSCATISTGLVTGFRSLLMMRFLLGLGESAAYPAYSKILSAFPEKQRGFANAAIDFGTKAGPALGVLLGLLIPRLGWRFFFVSIGTASLLWLIPWLRWGPDGIADGVKGRRGPGLLVIASNRTAWGTFLGLFCFNYTFYFLLTWLPSYLVMERRFSMDAMAVYGALPFCATAAASLACGWLSDRLIARGLAVSLVRKSFAISGLLICAANLPAVLVGENAAAMVFLVFAFVGIGMFTSNVWAITQTLAGVDAAGKWTGLQNAIGNMGGVAAPIVTGLLVDRLGSFQMAFLAAAAMLVVAAATYGWMVGRVEPILWPVKPQKELAFRASVDPS